VTEAWDSGASWSASLSHNFSFGVRPYATLSRSTILLDGNNNSLLNDVIAAGHVGSAELKEFGIKGSWLNGRLTIASTVYEQGRIGVEKDDVANVINAYATSTTSQGWQTEIKWVIADDFLLTLYGLNQKTYFTPNVGGIIQLDARALGFADVRDENGTLVYPAEAFLYGGRAGIVLPDDMDAYARKQGNPDRQFGMNALYQINKHWGLTVKSNYLSSTCSGRLCLVRLPSSQVFDAGIYWMGESFELKLDIANITDEQYFRARTGDTLGDVIAQAMSGRRAQLSATMKF
jgi:iron complex outermembrane receptor protein